MHRKRDRLHREEGRKKEGGRGSELGVGCMGGGGREVTERRGERGMRAANGTEIYRKVENRRCCPNYNFPSGEQRASKTRPVG